MVVFFFRAAVETFVAAWMSKSVSLSSFLPPPTTKIIFWEFLGKPHNFKGKKTFWHLFFLEKLIWNNEKEFQYDWKHRDATRPCFFCGLFCGWIKKRCQRQIIYFSRRSVIKVFAPTPQTAFLRSPITVEIIIIGRLAPLLVFFQWQEKMQSKICLSSVGNVVKRENLRIISISLVCFQPRLAPVKSAEGWQHGDYDTDIWRRLKNHLSRWNCESPDLQLMGRLVGERREFGWNWIKFIHFLAVTH